MGDEEQLELVFPSKGMDVTTEFGAQPPGTTPLGINVRLQDPLLTRDRGGSREGMVKFTPQLPGGADSFQDIQQLVLTNADMLGSTFEFFDPDFIPDPSDPDRDIRPGGSAFVPARNRPQPIRRRVSVVVSQPTQVNGGSVTVTATLTLLPGGSFVDDKVLTLHTIPPGRNGDGSTTTTDVNGEGAFVVSEASFSGNIIYWVTNEYEYPP